MTEAEILLTHNTEVDFPPVRVTANDYSYDGWLVSVFPKRSRQLRCVVEDANGRLFVHNAAQLAAR